MTKKEFIERRDSAERESGRFGLVGTVLLGVMFLAFAACAPWMDTFPADSPAHTVFGTTVVGLLGAGITLFFWLITRPFRNHRLCCPACARPLTHVLGQIAVATGKCGSCGATVFNEGESSA